MNAPSSWERPNSSLSPTIAGSILPVIAIADVAISRPSMSAPASPMNSLAGRQFSGRKPMHAPIEHGRDERREVEVGARAVSRTSR